MARTTLFAVVAMVVSMTQVASAQVRGGFVAGPGFAAGGVRAPGFVAGGTRAPFQATRGAAVATPFRSAGVMNTFGPLGAASARGFNGPLVNGGQVNAIGPVGAVSAGQVNGFGRTAQGTTITGPAGNSLQAGHVSGPRGTLNAVHGPAGNTVLVRTR